MKLPRAKVKRKGREPKGKNFFIDGWIMIKLVIIKFSSASKPRRSSLSGWEVRKGKTTAVPKPKPDDSKGKKATKQAPGKIQPKKKEKEDEEEKDEVGEDKE